MASQFIFNLPAFSGNNWCWCCTYVGYSRRRGNSQSIIMINCFCSIFSVSIKLGKFFTWCLKTKFHATLSSCSPCSKSITTNVRNCATYIYKAFCIWTKLSCVHCLITLSSYFIKSDKSHFLYRIFTSIFWVFI